MDDDPIDRLIREASAEYHRPPETPREEIWSRIRAEMAERADRRRPRHRPGLLRLGVGIAAVLAVGFGLGRLVPREQGMVISPALQAERGAGSAAAYHIAAVEHLGQAEAFLTLFRTSVREGGGGQDMASATARQLLATNRLLLDSPVASDRKLRLLLQDLELVLAEIAQLAPASRAEELELITRSLQRADVMARLRTEVPAGPGAVTRQGAL